MRRGGPLRPADSSPFEASLAPYETGAFPGPPGPRSVTLGFARRVLPGWWPLVPLVQRERWALGATKPEIARLPGRGGFREGGGPCSDEARAILPEGPEPGEALGGGRRERRRSRAIPPGRTSPSVPLNAGAPRTPGRVWDRTPLESDPRAARGVLALAGRQARLPAEGPRISSTWAPLNRGSSRLVLVSEGSVPPGMVPVEGGGGPA